MSNFIVLLLITFYEKYGIKMLSLFLLAVAVASSELILINIKYSGYFFLFPSIQFISLAKRDSLRRIIFLS